MLVVEEYFEVFVEFAGSSAGAPIHNYNVFVGEYCKCGWGRVYDCLDVFCIVETLLLSLSLQCGSCAFKFPWFVSLLRPNHRGASAGECW